MSDHDGGRRRALDRSRIPLLAVAVSAIMAGCSSATAVWTVRPAPTETTAPVRIFVMPPLVEIGAPRGNIGQDSSDVQRAVESRVLSIVHEVDPGARVADPTGNMPFLPMSRYIDAVAPSRATRGEVYAAGDAVRHAGTHLLVPTIVQWRQMRTDDPIGALLPAHNGVVISLRFVRLDPPALVGSVTFENRGRVTLNQSAARLLNDDFRKTLLQLLRP